MPIQRIVQVVDGAIDLWAFHPVDSYAVEEQSDGVIVLAPASAEQRGFAAQIGVLEDGRDCEPGVTIRPLYGNGA